MPRGSLIGIATAVASLALAGAASSGTLPGAGSLPNGWTHASINVVIGRVPHTLLYDRGQVQAASPASLSLKEADGNVVTVPVGPATQYTVNGRRGSLAQIPVGANVTSEQLDGNPADRVDATVPARLLVPAAPAAHVNRKHRR